MSLQNELIKSVKRHCELRKDPVLAFSPLTTVSDLNLRTVGEEFIRAKYEAGTESDFMGVHPLIVHYESGKHSGDLPVIVKGKSEKDFTRTVYPRMLAHFDIELPILVQNTFIHLEFEKLYLGERYFYTLQKVAPDLLRYTPAYYGGFWDQENKDSYIFLEAVTDLVDANDNTGAKAWSDARFNTVFDGLAALHAPFYGDTKLARRKSDIVGPFKKDQWVESTCLWQAMATAMLDNNPDIMTESLYEAHNVLIDTLPDWRDKMDQLPKTVIHGDFNPRNIGFRKNDDGTERLCAMDWECARIHVPQFDVVQFLLYACKPNTIDERGPQYCDYARLALQAASKKSIDKAEWDAGIRYALMDHMINRLPLLTLIFDQFPPTEGNYGAACYENAVHLLHRMTC